MTVAYCDLGTQTFITPGMSSTTKSKTEVTPHRLPEACIYLRFKRSVPILLSFCIITMHFMSGWVEDQGQLEQRLGLSYPRSLKIGTYPAGVPETMARPLLTGNSDSPYPMALESWSIKACTTHGRTPSASATLSPRIAPPK